MTFVAAVLVAAVPVYARTVRCDSAASPLNSIQPVPVYAIIDGKNETAGYVFAGYRGRERKVFLEVLRNQFMTALPDSKMRTITLAWHTLVRTRNVTARVYVVRCAPPPPI